MSEPKRNILPVVDEPEDKPRQRARTMSRKEMARLFRQQAAAGGLDPELQTLMAELDASRPQSRGDCAEGERPCPYVSCKYNLYVDVNPRTGSVKMNFPDKELWELAETCALDVADRARRIEAFRAAVLSLLPHAPAARQESELDVLAERGLRESHAARGEEVDDRGSGDPLRVLLLQIVEVVPFALRHRHLAQGAAPSDAAPPAML